MLCLNIYELRTFICFPYLHNLLVKISKISNVNWETNVIVIIIIIFLRLLLTHFIDRRERVSFSQIGHSHYNAYAERNKDDVNVFSTKKKYVPLTFIIFIMGPELMNISQKLRSRTSFISIRTKVDAGKQFALIRDSDSNDWAFFVIIFL